MEKINDQVLNIFDGEHQKGARPKLWDGRAGDRIVEILASGSC